MVRGLYTAYTGMEAQQQKLDIVSNNLANVNTSGYKQDNVAFRSFKEVLATKIDDPEVPADLKIGRMTLGVQVDQVFTSFAQGGLSHTEDINTMAIEGDGMIVVGQLQSDGSYVERYTRDGSFTRDQEGRLVTADGNFVLGQDGPIRIDEPDFAVTKNGSIYVNNEYVDQIRLTGFTDYSSLRKIGDNLYRTTEASEFTDFEGNLRQGYLESSNVNSVKEMVEMIKIMRTYEANQKVLTTYDATLENVVNNVGRL